MVDFWEDLPEAEKEKLERESTARRTLVPLKLEALRKWRWPYITWRKLRL